MRLRLTDTFTEHTLMLIYEQFKNNKKDTEMKLVIQAHLLHLFDGSYLVLRAKNTSFCADLMNISVP